MALVNTRDLSSWLYGGRVGKHPLVGLADAVFKPKPEFLLMVDINRGGAHHHIQDAVLQPEFVVLVVIAQGIIEDIKSYRDSLPFLKRNPL